MVHFPTTIDWSKTYRQIANELNCSIPSVRAEFFRQHPNAGRKFCAKVPPAEKPSWQKFKKWDWRMTNMALAEQHGFTKEYVRQIRKGLGLPPVTRLMIWENLRGKPAGTRIGTRPVFKKRPQQIAA